MARRWDLLVWAAAAAFVVSSILAIAVPSKGRSQLAPNERSAIETLRRIAFAQRLCRQSASVDVDRNNTGEFGYLAELAGTKGVRTRAGRAGRRKISPPLIPLAFGAINGSAVAHSGYLFQIYLPDRRGRPLPEAKDGGVGTRAPSPALAEELWCCYAWPADYGRSGDRAFFINQEGEILATSNADEAQRYGGLGRAPDAGAAFLEGTSGRMASRIASDTAGRDGGIWEVVVR